MRRILLGTIVIVASINTSLADTGGNEVMRPSARARTALDAAPSSLTDCADASGICIHSHSLIGRTS